MIQHPRPELAKVFTKKVGIRKDLERQKEEGRIMKWECDQSFACGGASSGDCLVGGGRTARSVGKIFPGQKNYPLVADAEWRLFNSSFLHPRVDRNPIYFPGLAAVC
jgi:hypothetical protein